MREHVQEPPIPRLLLRAVIGLILFSIVAVVVGQLTQRGLVLTPPAPTVAERALKFETPEDGGLTVIDATSGAPVATLAPGTDGFVQGVLRALERERTLKRAEGPAVYTLSRHTDGRLTITDPLTGEHFALNGFGRDNLDTFARLLSDGEARP